jgi:DNA-binding NarL/FixJ family response regulator
VTRVHRDEYRRVLVADSRRLIAEALTFAVESDPRLDAVGYGLDGWDALELVSSYEPDVVVVGPSLNGLDQVQFTSLVREFFPNVEAILICERGDRVAAYDAGATSCLAESCSADELLRAITTLSQRETGRESSESPLRLVEAAHA